MVVVTALSDPQVTETALQKGAREMLPKTEALDQLVAAAQPGLNQRLRDGSRF